MLKMNKSSLCGFLLFIAFTLTQGQRFATFNSRNSQSFPNSQQFQQQQQGSFPCPEKTGRFPTAQCDSYIECIDGVGEEKFCPDGLLFNALTNPLAFPCQYPIDVDCVGRTTTQPAQPTEDCPHQYGYYKIGDEANCGQFKNCVAGRAFTFDCPEGLAFNEESYRCDWPDQVQSCNAEAFLGFTCPPEAKTFAPSEYKYFRSPNDCQRYFICIENKPRLYNCGEGQAFNDLTNSCDGIENVTGCLPQYNQNYDQSRRNFRV
ncbi:protein obstructor-E-like [Onthophagus taurus]|uniref:protein obstructor-E-like n=1 Tax=Onthophagus taurus TaxID=166361 RepID=UPI0039BEA08B